MVLRAKHSGRLARAGAQGATTAADDPAPHSTAHGMRPQCPCCAPQAEFQRPSQRLAQRLAALREREAEREPVKPA